MSEAPAAVVDKRAAERRQSNTRIFFTTLVVIAVLYLAKPVVVPVALAILFAFLLTPIVSILERTFLRRTGAIVLSVGLAVTALSLGGWWIYSQFNSVAQEFTQSGTIQRVEQKLRFLRRSSTGLAVFERFQRTLQRVTEPPGPEEKPLNVRVINDNSVRERYRHPARSPRSFRFERSTHRRIRRADRCRSSRWHLADRASCLRDFLGLAVGTGRPPAGDSDFRLPDGRRRIHSGA